MRLDRQTAGIAHDGRDLVTALQGLLDEAPSCSAGGAEDRESHG